MFRSSLLTIALVTLVPALAWSLPPVNSIMQKMESMQDQQVDVTAKVNLTQEKVNQGTKVYESLFFRRDRDDSFLMIMTAPDSEKGNGYLKVGDNFWMYRQNTRTFQHINRDEDINGTDTKAGDFEKRKFTELYRPSVTNGQERISEAMLGKKRTYKFEVVAKVNDVTYPKQIYWVDRDSYLPLKVESYSLSGTLMNTAYYPQYTMIEGKYFLLQDLFIDEFEKGNKTLMVISGISMNPIPDSVFTKAYLENLSK